MGSEHRGHLGYPCAETPPGGVPHLRCAAGRPEAQEGLLWAAHLRVPGCPQGPVWKCWVGRMCDNMHEDPCARDKAPFCWPCHDSDVLGGQGSWGSLVGPQGSGKTL